MRTAKQCAQLILDSQDQLILKWEEEVRNEVIASGLSSTAALQNHLPELLGDIAKILIEKADTGFDHKNDAYLRTVDKTEIHGKLRANTENYTIDQIIKEYIILHRLVTELLQDQGLLSINIVNLIKYVFEKTIERSSQVFIETLHETRDKLIGTLAHDIRNPLSVALLSAELLSGKTEEDKQLAEIIEKSITRSILLTEGLLDTLSLKAGQGMMMNFTEDDYAHIVGDTCGELKQIYATNIDCKVPDRKIPAVMDTVAVKRVIENLVSNAIKYGDPKATIDIWLEDDGGHVELKVKNYGNPIPEERQESIFNFLHGQGNGAGGGSKSWGIGLSLVKLIVDAHEGDVTLKSSKTDGTTFAIRFKKDLNHSGKTRMKPEGHQLQQSLLAESH